MTTTIWDRLAARRSGADPGSPGGIWERLAAEFDPGTFRPTLARDVEIKEFHLRWGSDYAMIANPRDLLHYRLEPGELETVRLMDGTRTLKEIVVDRFRESGELEMEGVADLVRSLQEGGFLEPPFVDTYAAVRRAMNPSVTRAKLREFARTLSVDWTAADRVVRWLYRRGFRLFFNRWVAVAGLAVGILGFAAFLDVTRSGRFSLSGRSVAVEFLILGLLNYFITFTHELGHALGVIHYGRRIKSAGFMIYYGSPAWFIEASDTLMLDPGKRIVQSFAGPVAEIMVAGAASVVMWAFPEALISSTLYKFAVLNYFIIFMNLVPLLELDGYYILSDAIHVPDLRPRSLSFIRYDLWHKLRVRERFSAQEVGLALYGILGVAFAVFSLYASFFFWRYLFGNLILRMWNGGWPTRILLIVLALIIAGPLLRGLTALARSGWRRARAVWRRVRFRLEQGWRVEAAELIDALPLFEDLPVDVLNDLAGRVRLVTVARGQPVVRQGERPESFFVVRRGTLQAVEEDPATGNERVLRVLGRGESFGELGLLQSQPRAATVRALEEAEVFQIDKGTFDQLLSDMATVPDFAPTLQQVEELRSLPPFQHLEPAQLSDLLDHGQWVNLGPNETFITQGQPGDDFYVIGSGQVEVVRDGERRDVLGPGSHVGEIALLLDVPRTATVRTITPVRAYRLDREGFDGALGEAFRTGTLNPQAPVGRTGLH